MCENTVRAPTPALPVVCLPGLARTVADFDALAPALADGPPSRRVIAIDARGRGQSDYDSNPENYNLAVELGDVVTVLTALEVGEAVLIGSSRGGLLSMLLGVAHPTSVAGVVLHDIGPVIEPKGLARIKSYVGKLPQPRNFGEGAEILRRLFDAQFPRLTGEQWLAAAQRTWKMDSRELVPTYDVQLARMLAEFDIERPLPVMWTEFDALVARADSGHPRRQLRYSFGRHGNRHARSPSNDGIHRNRGPGACSVAR